MASAVGLILAGLVLLAAGGEALLRGAVALSTLLRLTPAIIGLTVVAAGTSFPELSVTLLAAVRDQPDIAVGNVVGSNIFNIGFILGICALIRPLKITGNSIRLEYPVLAVVTLMCLALSQDGTLNWLDGALLLVIYVLFTVYMVTLVRRQVTALEASEFDAQADELAHAPRIGPSILWVLVGIGALAGGAALTVEGASTLARQAGLSERVIGLTIVAAGTSLPEIVASLLSTIRGRDDIAIANVVGSNIFNILGILGASALASPLPIHDSIAGFDCWWMLGITVLLFPIMFTRLRVDRWEGAGLLVAYCLYTTLLLSSGPA